MKNIWLRHCLKSFISFNNYEQLKFIFFRIKLFVLNTEEIEKNVSFKKSGDETYIEMFLSYQLLCLSFSLLFFTKYHSKSAETQY